MKELEEMERLVYMPAEIGAKLGLSRANCYKYLNEVYELQSPFRVIKIKTCIRIPKEGFDKWFKGIS